MSNFNYVELVIKSGFVSNMVGVKSEGTKYKTWENWIIVSLDAKLPYLRYPLIRFDGCCKLREICNKFTLDDQ